MNRTLPLPSAASSENFQWIADHFEKLVRQHPNCWIAVDKGQVLAADPDLGNVRKTVASNPRLNEIVFHFIDDGSLIFTVS